MWEGRWQIAQVGRPGQDTKSDLYFVGLQDAGGGGGGGGVVVVAGESVRKPLDLQMHCEISMQG
jgi:hypothetical protein